jgi:glycosyltransferase involved in cell wall biosynthesis
MGIRVLHVMAGADFGGAETAFIDLIETLKGYGVQQAAVIRRHQLRARQLEKIGVPFAQVPFRKFFDFETKRAITRMVQSFKPDIVQSWMDRASEKTPNGPYIRVGWLGGYYKAKYYQGCDYIGAVTQDICQHMINQGWPESTTHLMRTFCKIEEDALPLDRLDYNTPEGVPLLLGLGRLHFDKSFDVLLKALVSVPEAYLWIAGDGVLRDELPKMARDLGVESRVRFLGWRTDRGALLKTADVCVFPSRVEPFGTVVVEAWAYRVPLVTAMSAGPKAHVRNEDNGLIVPIDNVEALAAAIREAIHNKPLVEKMVKNGWQDFQSHFTQDIVAQSYLDFYQKICHQTV